VSFKFFLKSYSLNSQKVAAIISGAGAPLRLMPALGDTGLF